MDWLAFIEKFGLPLTMLVAGGVLLARGVFVTGNSADARVADLKAANAIALVAAEQEKSYREERRLEERANRLLTEEALRNQVGVMRDMTELLKDIERNIRGSA